MENGDLKGSVHGNGTSWIAKLVEQEYSELHFGAQSERQAAPFWKDKQAEQAATYEEADGRIRGTRGTGD